MRLTAEITQSLQSRSLQPLTPVSELDQDDASATTGYDLVAAELSNSKSLPPLYRRFSRLSHRILLQLQDEIHEMEADLTRLDKEDQRVRARYNGQRLPSTRRMDYMWHQSPLQGHRLALIGNIHVKLEQYSTESNVLNQLL